jgi:hypothetical protein
MLPMQCNESAHYSAGSTRGNSRCFGPIVIYWAHTLVFCYSRAKEQCCYKLTLETQTDSSRRSIAVAFMIYTFLKIYDYFRKFIYDFLHVFVISFVLKTLTYVP